MSASSTPSWPTALIVTLAGALFFLAACGREHTEPETTDAETPSETTKVSAETEDLCPCKAPFADFRHRDNWWRALSLEEAVDKCITQGGIPALNWNGVGPFGVEVASLTCILDSGRWDENHPTPGVCYFKAINVNSDCDQTRR